MRTYRSDRRAQELGTNALPNGGEPVRHVGSGNSNDDVTCRLCFESFETGAAYSKHFKERRFPTSSSFGPADVHSCLSRQEMRDIGNLVPNWETGAWKVRS